MEETLSIIKPDAVERNLENKIKSIFIENNFEIVKEKKVKLEKKDAEQFYKVHQTKPFYNDLCNYLSSGPVVVMVLKKNNAIVFFNELIKKGDKFLLTDLKVTTAIDHKKAAISIAIYPIKGVDINLLIYIYSIT